MVTAAAVLLASALITIMTAVPVSITDQSVLPLEGDTWKVHDPHPCYDVSHYKDGYYLVGSPAKSTQFQGYH